MSLLSHEGSVEMMLPSGFLKMVERQLAISFESLFQENDITSTEAHCGNLKNFQSFWRRIHSDSTCLVCLSREPQYGLLCGHSVCKTCVQIFANWHHTDPCRFKIHLCFLCGLEFSEITIKVKSATAGVRILLIDGGGVHEIFPLRILELLNDRVGLPYPIQENFNEVFGISSDKLPSGTSASSLIKTFIQIAWASWCCLSMDGQLMCASIHLSLWQKKHSDLEESCASQFSFTYSNWWCGTCPIAYTLLITWKQLLRRPLSITRASLTAHMPQKLGQSSVSQSSQFQKPLPASLPTTMK